MSWSALAVVIASSTASAQEGMLSGREPIEPFAAVLWRGDIISSAQSDSVALRRRGNHVVDDILDSGLGLYAEHGLRWTPWLRSVAGLRLDHFAFEVDDEIGDGSGAADVEQLSPKGSLIATPREDTDIYIGVEIGLHSNARARAGEAKLGTSVVGYELGARSRLADRIELSGSAWLLDLDSERVWIDDETSELRGRSRRAGVELEARAQLASWLEAELGVTFTRARFLDAAAGEDRVPLAPTMTVVAGLSAAAGSGLFGRLGARRLSDRPLAADGSVIAEGFTSLDATAGYRTSGYELSLAIEGALDTERHARVESPLAATPPTNAMLSAKLFY